MSIYQFYRCIIVDPNEQIIANVLRRGRFRSEGHFYNLMRKWNGKDCNGYEYIFYGVADPGGMGIPPLADHENTLVHLA